MTYVHELPNWPEFTWDMAALSHSLGSVRHKQGKHVGKMEGLGFDARTEASLVSLTVEVVKSSAIEGEHLDLREVRSSIAQKLGLDAAGLPKPSREVDGIVAIMLDATREFDQPLTAERLFDWHAALFPTGRSGMLPIRVGSWRGPESGAMQVVSGALGKEVVHFVAPDAARLDAETSAFFDWFNAPPAIDPVLKAAVAHFWFVTIHPFEDGNGRIARAIAELALTRADGTTERYYSMSSGIEAQRREYYRQLEAAQRGDLDLTAWITWFLECLDRTLNEASATLSAVLGKARLWQLINSEPVNERQRRVINRLLDNFKGHLTTSKYVKIAKCSSDTALRDISKLVDRGILLKNLGGGRSTSYRLAEPDELASR